MTILFLVFFFALAILGIVAFLLRKPTDEPKNEQRTAVESGECCGAHAVCEKDRLLNTKNEIVYFDDEELDALAGKTDFTDEEIKMLEDVFYTLRESDVAGWLCSLQLRNIHLPADLQDAALLIVSERRARTALKHQSLQ